MASLYASLLLAALCAGVVAAWLALRSGNANTALCVFAGVGSAVVVTAAFRALVIRPIAHRKALAVRRAARDAGANEDDLLVLARDAGLTFVVDLLGRYPVDERPADDEIGAAAPLESNKSRE